MEKSFNERANETESHGASRISLLILFSVSFVLNELNKINPKKERR